MWMAVCLAFVFLGLLEFAYVNVQSRVLSRRKSLYMIRDPGLPNGKSSNGEVSGSNEASSGIDSICYSDTRITIIFLT